MQSAGHAAAHREQPTHFSSPLWWRHRRWRPRKRGYTGRLYSGYCCVIGFLKICLNVTPKPRIVLNGCGLISVRPDDDEGRDERVQRRGREQDLPAEAHQLVVAKAWQRRPQPDEQEQEDRQLE